jgi:hypothetical protein
MRALPPSPFVVVFLPSWLISFHSCLVLLFLLRLLGNVLIGFWAVELPSEQEAALFLTPELRGQEGARGRLFVTNGRSRVRDPMR